MKMLDFLTTHEATEDDLKLFKEQFKKNDLKILELFDENRKAWRELQNKDTANQVELETRTINVALPKSTWAALALIANIVYLKTDMGISSGLKLDKIFSNMITHPALGELVETIAGIEDRAVQILASEYVFNLVMDFSEEAWKGKITEEMTEAIKTQNTKLLTQKINEIGQHLKEDGVIETNQPPVGEDEASSLMNLMETVVDNDSDDDDEEEN